MMLDDNYFRCMCVCVCISSPISHKTEILVMTKRNMWLITRHSSHHWILCLSRKMLHGTDYISEIERYLQLSRRSSISVSTFDWNYYVNIPCSNMIVFPLYHWILCLSRKMLHDDFSRLYWIPKLHNNPYRGNNTTGAYSFWRS
jgi:hypothetical protein